VLQLLVLLLKIYRGGWKMFKKFSLLLVALFALTFSTGIASAADTATAYVVHGIPGLVVDVYVNGQLAQKNFQPGTIAGPLTGPAGTGNVVIVPAGGDPKNPALAATLTLNAGQNVTAVAHLDANGAPTLSVFDNNVSKTSNARVVVRHTAAAPAVDLLVSPGSASEQRFGPLSNGQQAQVEVAAGTYTGEIVPTGTSTPVIGPASFNFEAGKVYFAYVIGSLANGTATTLLQVVPVGS
jgi:hypothetical protein